MRSGDHPKSLAPIVLAGAMVAAPFLALLIRAEAGLVVMAIALGAASYLLRGALEATPVRARFWLRIVIVINALIALACAGVAGWLLVG